MFGSVFKISLPVFLIFSSSVFASSEEVRPLFKNKPELLFSEKLDGVKNLSGAAWLPEESHYLLVSSKPAALHEVAVLGERVRKIRTVKLREFKSVSGVAYVGRAESGGEGARIALTETEKAEVSFCDLDPTQGELKRGRCKTYKIDGLMFWEKKFGIKGVAVNNSGDVPVFYFGKERMPKRMYKSFFEDGQWNVKASWDAEAMMPAESVISDLFYDNSLFVLDGSGRRVFQMDPLTGQTVSEFHAGKTKKTGLSGLCVVRRAGGAQMVLTSSGSRYFIYDISEKAAA